MVSGLCWFGVVFYWCDALLVWCWCGVGEVWCWFSAGVGVISNEASISFTSATFNYIVFSLHRARNRR